MRTVVETMDGFKTLIVNSLDETYHSRHGAWQEANHVFIENGIMKFSGDEIHILELGFGTGLNTLATAWAIRNKKMNVHYHSIEKYPITMEEVQILDYGQQVPDKEWGRQIMNEIHKSKWEIPQLITENFTLYKYNISFTELHQLNLPKINLIYFDCFGSRVQPDLWERPFLDKIVEIMGKGSLLTTYSSKGTFRRALQELGLKVSKIPGPKGKREMIQAWKYE